MYVCGQKDNICPVILSFHALMSGVHPILNVHLLKYVITWTLHPQRKNVSLFVQKIHALQEHLVKLITIVKFVLVIILFKEMDMFHVLKSEYQMSLSAGSTKIVKRSWLALISLARTHVE